MPQTEGEQLCPTAEEQAQRSTVEKGVVHPRSRSCRGCLFYSSILRDTNQNPACYGFSRSIPQSYRTLEEREATKDFKYACLGYGLHKEVTATPNAKPPEGNGELPLCVGIKFLADRKPVGQAAAHSHKDKEEHEEHMHNPLARHGAASEEDFTSRFCRNASKVATAIVDNVIRVAGGVKATVDDIFGSGDKNK